MQYPHTPERSTELLRQALPLMSRQAAAMHPMSYAVWYAYVADAGSPLRSEVDRHLAQAGTLDEATTETLFRRFIADGDPAAQARLGEALQQLIGGISAHAALAKDQTSRYGITLERLAGELAGDAAVAPPDPPAVLEELMLHTRQMQTDMSQLQRRLADSQREIEQLRHEVKCARQESMVDALTGLANRRAFERRLAECLAGAAADASHAPSMVMLDLDHFKRINDSYGHPFGDQVLRAVAQVLQQQVKEPALAARVGGEEFAVLLPATALADAMAVAEKLRATVASCRIRRKGQHDTAERVTVSLGVAALRQGDGAEQIIDRADRALYTAKAAGRDRVMAATEH